MYIHVYEPTALKTIVLDFMQVLYMSVNQLPQKSIVFEGRHNLQIHEMSTSIMSAAFIIKRLFLVLILIRR